MHVDESDVAELHCDFGPKHSTPIKKSTSMIATRGMYQSMKNQRLLYSSLPFTSFLSGVHQPDYSLNIAANNSSQLHPHSLGTLCEKSTTEGENLILAKQREEITLLVKELHERDKELNEMVASHKQQLQAWEQDRQLVLHLQQKCVCLQDQLKEEKKSVAMATLVLNKMKNKYQSQDALVKSAQTELERLTTECCCKTTHLKQLENQNGILNFSLQEVCSAKLQLETKEKELLTELKRKESRLTTLETQVTKLTAQLKESELHCCQCKNSETEKLHTSDWKEYYETAVKENMKLKEMCQKKDESLHNLTVQLHDTLQKELVLQHALYTSCEREKNRDEVLQSLHTQQERTNLELKQIRNLYKRQNHEVALLHLTLDNSKDSICEDCIQDMSQQHIMTHNQADNSKDTIKNKEIPQERNTQDLLYSDSSAVNKSTDCKTCVHDMSGEIYCGPDGLRKRNFTLTAKIDNIPFSKYLDEEVQPVQDILLPSGTIEDPHNSSRNDSSDYQLENTSRIGFLHHELYSPSVIREREKKSWTEVVVDREKTASMHNTNEMDRYRERKVLHNLTENISNREETVSKQRLTKVEHNQDRRGIANVSKNEKQYSRLNRNERDMQVSAERDLELKQNGDDSLLCTGETSVRSCEKTSMCNFKKYCDKAASFNTEAHKLFQPSDSVKFCEDVAKPNKNTCWENHPPISFNHESHVTPASLHDRPAQHLSSLNRDAQSTTFPSHSSAVPIISKSSFEHERNQYTQKPESAFGCKPLAKSQDNKKLKNMSFDERLSSCFDSLEENASTIVYQDADSASPSTKLHRLLLESREMIQALEISAVPVLKDTVSGECPVQKLKR